MAGIAEMIGDMPTVRAPQAGGNEHLQRLNGECSRGVAEQALGQAVGSNDPSGLIHHERGVRRQAQPPILDSEVRIRRHRVLFDGFAVRRSSINFSSRSGRS